MITLDGIVLSSELLWSDEFANQNISQSVKHTLSGGTVVFSTKAQSKSITLQSLSDQGWIDRATVEQLQLISQVPNGVYTLNIRGVDYSVMFRHNEPPAFKADPVLHVANPDSDSYYTVEIRLITV